MKRGHLSQYFTGVAAKRLSAVEADVRSSNQHELNGVAALKRILGKATDSQHLAARFIYLSDHDEEPVVAEGFLTWYDARARDPKRTEHRLYFPPNAVMERAVAGDLLVIGRRPDGSVLLVVAEQDSTAASQVQWLFGTADLADAGYAVRDDLEEERDRIALAARLVLEQIGVEVEPPPDTHLEEMLRRFGGGFPKTRDFSAFARSTLPDVDPGTEPDAVAARLDGARGSAVPHARAPPGRRETRAGVCRRCGRLRLVLAVRPQPPQEPRRLRAREPPRECARRHGRPLRAHGRHREPLEARLPVPRRGGVPGSAVPERID